MSDGNPHPYDSALGERSELWDRVAELEAGLASLREDLSREVRTRRVVIVECDGFERGILAADGDSGKLRLVGRPLVAGSDATAVEVFALDPIDNEGPQVGVELVERGNGVSGYSVIERHAARLWDDRSHADPPARD